MRVQAVDRRPIGPRDAIDVYRDLDTRVPELLLHVGERLALLNAGDSRTCDVGREGECVGDSPAQEAGSVSRNFLSACAYDTNISLSALIATTPLRRSVEMYGAWEVSLAERPLTRPSPQRDSDGPVSPPGSPRRSL